MSMLTIEQINKLKQEDAILKEKNFKLLQVLQKIEEVCKMDCGDCEFSQDCDCNYQECEESKLDYILDLMSFLEDEVKEWYSSDEEFRFRS